MFILLFYAAEEINIIKLEHSRCYGGSSEFLFFIIIF